MQFVTPADSRAGPSFVRVVAHPSVATPVPTSDDIAETAAEIAETGVQSVTTGDQTTVAIDPLKLDDLAQRKKAREASAGNGGCGWSGLAKSRVVPGGMTS